MIGQWRIGRTIGKGSSGGSNVSTLLEDLADILGIYRSGKDCQTCHYWQIRSHQDRTQGLDPHFADVNVGSRSEGRQGLAGNREGDCDHEADRPS